MFIENFKIFRKTNANNVAGGIIILKKTKKIVVVEQLNNTWSLPKGHVEKKETLLEAAKREIYEETGLKQINLIGKEKSYKRYKIGLDKKDDKSELKIIHLFVFETYQNKLLPKDEKNPQAKWIPSDEVAKVLTHKNDKKFFVKFLKKKGKKYGI